MVFLWFSIAPCYANCQVEFSIRQIDNKTEAIDVHVLGHGGHGGHGPVIPAHRGSAVGRSRRITTGYPLVDDDGYPTISWL